MTIEEIIHASASGLGLLVVLILGFIKIPKLEINIWGLIGRSINKEVTKKIENIEKRFETEDDKFEALGDKFDSVNKRFDETDAKIEDAFDYLDEKLERHIEINIKNEMKQRRRAILEFDDALLDGNKKSKEHYIDILSTIDQYEEYCQEHPNFPNNMCKIAIEHIKDQYAEHLEHNDFK